MNRSTLQLTAAPPRLSPISSEIGVPGLEPKGPCLATNLGQKTLSLLVLPQEEEIQQHVQLEEVGDDEEHGEVRCFVVLLESVENQKEQEDGGGNDEDGHHDAKGGVGSLFYLTGQETRGLHSAKGSLRYVCFPGELLGLQVHEGLEHNGKSASHDHAHHKPKRHQRIAQQSGAFLLDGTGRELDDELEPPPDSELERDDADERHSPRNADQNFHHQRRVSGVAKWEHNPAEFVDAQHSDVHPASSQSNEDKRAKNLAPDGSKWPVTSNAGYDYSNAEREGQDHVGDEDAGAQCKGALQVFVELDNG